MTTMNRLEPQGLIKDRDSMKSRLAIGRHQWSTQEFCSDVVALLRIAAQGGEAEALYLLGLACFRGQGVPQDVAAARELHLAAAELGSVDAQFELSLLLDLGIGGTIDPEGAKRWETTAALAGHPRACLNRGARLANEAQPNWQKVAFWYARAAEAGNVEAANRLRAMVEQAGQESGSTTKEPLVREGQGGAESAPGTTAMRDKESSIRGFYYKGAKSVVGAEADATIGRIRKNAVALLAVDRNSGSST